MKKKISKINEGGVDEDGQGEDLEEAKLDRRYRDKRYRRTERAIDKAYFKMWPNVKMIKLAKQAKISRSTLYEHHKNKAEIMPDLERRTLWEYKRDVVDGSLVQKLRIKVMFYQMLTFVRQNRGEFEVIVRRGDMRVLDKMIEELLPEVIEKYHWPNSYKEMLMVYEHEIVAVVESWILDDFKGRRVEVLRDIMYLTREARKHLMPLGH